MANVSASNGSSVAQVSGQLLRVLLEGRSDRTKAYAIATVVIGRDQCFDPHMDPIVRIEASRLRLSLDRYYLASDGGDPVRINLQDPGVRLYLARPVHTGIAPHLCSSSRRLWSGYKSAAFPQMTIAAVHISRRRT